MDGWSCGKIELLRRKAGPEWKLQGIKEGSALPQTAMGRRETWRGQGVWVSKERGLDARSWSVIFLGQGGPDIVGEGDRTTFT